MQNSDNNQIHFGGFTFERDTLVLRQGDDVMPLKRQSAQVLGLLIEAAGKVVTRDFIRDTIWHDRTIEFDHGINACIRDIRRVLRDRSKDPLYIETLPKVGYRFIGSIAEPLIPLKSVPITRWAMVGAVVLLLISLLVISIWPNASVDVEGDRIAVMPFREGELGADRSPMLRQLSMHTVRLLSERQDRLKTVSVAELFGGSDNNPGFGDVSRWLEVDYIVAGNIREEDGERLLNLRLIQTDGYIHLWSKSVSVSTGNETAALDELMAELLSELTVLIS